MKKAGFCAIAAIICFALVFILEHPAFWFAFLFFLIVFVLFAIDNLIEHQFPDKREYRYIWWGIFTIVVFTYLFR